MTMARCKIFKDRASFDSRVAPFGWYVAIYVLRFVELDRSERDDLDARFLTGENTCLSRRRT